MSLDKATNRFLQFADTGKNATVQSAAFQLTKPALHSIQPRGAGWCEVKLEPGMFFQSGFHLRCFVSRAVQNQMKVLLFRCFSINLSQKIKKLFGAVTLCAALVECDPVPGSAFFHQPTAPARYPADSGTGVQHAHPIEC